METWNYNPPALKNHFGMLDIQKDWNQTLITVLNMIRAQHNLPNPTIIKVPKRLIRLVESLEYYSHGLIGSSFIVDVIDENSTVMNVGGIDLMIENYD